MTHSRTSSKRATFTLLMLFIILVILPIGSWFYLQSGLEFRKERMNELDTLGSILPDSSDFLSHGNSSNSKDLHGKVSVLTVATDDNPIRTYQAQLLEQFDDRVDFGMVITGDYSRDSWYRKKENISSEKALFLVLERKVFDQSNAPWIQMDSLIDQRPVHFALLVDTSGTIRKMYDLELSEDRSRLVEHIALILPTENKRTTD